MTETARLRLPVLAAAQAQKHVTHNEALVALDTLVQLSVLDKDLTAPPGSPEEGDCYIVAASATGAWEGWDGRVARYEDGEWRSFLPGAGAGVGWLAYVRDEEALYVLKAGGWEEFSGGGGGSVPTGSGTWTPTLTFSTPGNLSVSYTNQVGWYYRIGDLVYVNFRLTCTPTYSTASGALRVAGLPFTVGGAGTHMRAGVFTSNTANLNFPTGKTSLSMIAVSGTDYIQLVADGDNAAAVSLSTADVPSGLAQDLFASLVYVAE